MFGVEGGLGPSFVQTVGCQNVLVEGWRLIRTVRCGRSTPSTPENVIVRDVREVTEGSNNDGVNPDSSRNVDRRFVLQAPETTVSSSSPA